MSSQYMKIYKTFSDCDNSVYYPDFPFLAILSKWSESCRFPASGPFVEMEQKMAIIVLALESLNLHEISV